MLASSLSLSNKRTRTAVALGSAESISMKKVEGNDDLLTAILVWLPAKSIFRFRSVSNRWNRIIANLFFLESYYRVQKERMRLVGYIQDSEMGNFANILPMPPTNEHNIDASVKLLHQFICSCNGLFSLKFISTPPETRMKDPMTFEYRILNPLTNRSIIVSEQPHEIRFPAAALVCDDQQENMRRLVLNYKLVVTGNIKNNLSSFMIQIFSSKTCKWTTSTLTATSDNFEILKWNENIVVNGIIYWYTDRSSLAVYDTTSVNDDETTRQQQLQLIELPWCCLGQVNHSIVRSSSSPDDALWYCVDIKPSTEIKMWMLPNNEYDRYNKCATTIPKSEWILMHNISYQLICKSIILPVVDPSKFLNDIPHHEVINTQLAGLLPWMAPHAALLTFGERIYFCNLEEVQYHHGTAMSGFHYFAPYMEPLCLSAYALCSLSCNSLVKLNFILYCLYAGQMDFFH